jgi:predicted aldo/keto reductase-like oxidoreductase
MPLSVTDGANKNLSFEHTALPAALEKKMGVIAMKTTGVGGIIAEHGGSIEECLRYVWSLPISTAILGCETPEQVETDVKIAVSMASQQLSKNEMDEVRAKWAKADFPRLENWKVDQSSRSA